MHEFELIELIQTIQSEYNTQSDYVNFGIGDDCASLSIPDNYDLVISTDTLVDGIHFNAKLSAEAIGHKALAVNLSDIAAMGAKPIAVTLNLTLPAIDKPWLSQFLHSFLKLADQYQVVLIGGDTTKGPLSISVTAHGIVKENTAIKRSTAQVNDDIYVSGLLGEAAFILQHNAVDKKALHTPLPHVELGLALQGIATAMIDISDGLSSDLQHILKASHKGAIIQTEKIPIGIQLSNANKDTALDLALHGGEDYVLCFTAAKNKYQELEKLQLQFTNLHKIGVITEAQDFILQENNNMRPINSSGYNHFNDE